jgi:succinyl-diaminopimelate desuccinylase
VAIPTVTGQHSENNQALDIIERYLDERGFYIVRTEYEGFGALIATTQPTKTPRVMLVGHIDVVPALEKQFTVYEEDGKLFGRGVYDMKGAIAGYLVAVDTLKDELANYDFGFMITTDEEGADLGVKKLIADGFCPTEAAVLLDGAYDWQLAKAAKGAWYAHLAIEDTTGHGSRPWLVNSSSMRMVRLLNDIQALFPEPGPKTNTLNINMISGGAPGEAYNQIPAYTQAGLDIRVLSNEERIRIESAVAKLCKKYGATLKTLVEFTAITHNLDDPHMQSFAQHLEAHTGITNNGVVSLAASDANRFVDLGLECIVTYPLGGGHHSANEWIDAKALEDIPRIICSYLEDMARINHKSLVESKIQSR